jgi:hypothetical protein
VHQDVKMLAEAIRVALPRPNRNELKSMLPGIDAELVQEAAP